MSRRGSPKHFGSIATLLVLLGMLSGALPSAATHTSTSASGEGEIVGTLHWINAWPPSTDPPLLPCAEYDIMSYSSSHVTDFPYVVTYRIGTFEYAGPVKTRYEVDLTNTTSFENPRGSFATLADCRALNSTPGATFPIKNGGKLEGGPVNGRSIDCTYSGGTWRRVGSEVTVSLDGNCTITVDGVTSPSTATHEERVVEAVPTRPAPETTVGVEKLSAS